MNQILQTKLKKLKKELEIELKELSDTFFQHTKFATEQDVTDQVEKENRLCLKYKKTKINITDEIVEIQFAIEDLARILRKDQLYN